MTALSTPSELAGRIEAIQRKHAGIRHEGARLGGSSTPWPNFNTRGELARQPAPPGEFFDAKPGLTPESICPISKGKFERSWGLLPTGLDEIDEALGGGVRPGLHEWYGAKERQQGNEATRQRGQLPDDQITKSEHRLSARREQSAPLCLLVHLAWQALEMAPERWVIWVGQKCFPYPAVLVRDAGRDLRLLRRSLFVKAESPAARVWAADLAVRCGLAGAVIADGAGLEMPSTRRLQLSARSHGAFIFLARPPQDLDRLSAAATRWLVRMERQPDNEATRQQDGLAISPYRPIALSPNSSVNTCSTGTTLPHYPMTPLPNPQWSLELLRCKGMQPSTSRRVWLVEWNRVTNAVRPFTQVCDSFENEARRHEATKARGAQG